MRLIDADKITNKEILYYLGLKYASCAEDVRNMISDAPTVDAVEVVRCKDCMFSKKVDRREPKYECENICRDGCTQWLSSKDYCSYGYRKESVSE